MKEHTMWPDHRVRDLFNIELPIIQAPMAGSVGSEMVIAVSEAGGLGSLPCAMLSPEQMRNELGIIRQRTSLPINLNFFCHQPPQADSARENAWKQRLASYYFELGLDPQAPVPAAARAPFGSTLCDLVEEFAPEVVSFHFGLPERTLLERVRATGAKIISSATTVDEARWLEDQGCDTIIAQGYEAGGHRGFFLTEDISTQAGTMALVPQVVDAVKVPVIAAGGIADARGIVAAFALGASAVQMGTAYLFCPEAKVIPFHRDALKGAKDNDTVLTNVFTGRPARGIVNRIVREVGPMLELAPQFPLASGAVTPLRIKAEAAGSGDFSPLWSGQAAALGRDAPAGELTRQLGMDAGAILSRLASAGSSAEGQVGS
jgi:nitronate monooxygenase